MALERIRYQAAGNFSYQAQNHADVEGYLLPLGRARDSALHSWGVAGGLRVTATAGSTEVKVSTGSALDAAGRVIVLADGGRAVVNQEVSDQTVKVSADGVTLDTGGLALLGDRVLTLTWQEVMGNFDAMGGSQQQGWLLAPWLRLLPLSGFEDTGQQVVLAQLTFGSGGQVKTLSPGLRRAVGVPVERLEFRRPSGSNSATLKVEDAPAAALRARTDGGLDVNVPSADGAGSPALSVVGGTGTLKVQGGLQIEGGAWDKDGLRLISSSSGNESGLRLESSASDARSYVTYAGSDGRWHFADRDADRDRLLIDSTGNVAIGSFSPQRALHVEGTEVHSGGVSGGFSFSDRTASSGAFVESPAAGERWRWYAQGGQARLWSGTDQITIGKGGNGDALDVPRRMRVRQGSDLSAGIWFRQKSGNTDHGFVGMASDSLVGFYGPGGADFGLVMDTSTGNVRLGKGLSLSPQRALHVEGTEVHSGGPTGGFSFADRTASSGAFVESPSAGQRWVWYSQGGQARLWSGTDQITVGKGANGDALDVPRRMRVRQGSDLSAGIWFRQKSGNTDHGFVGMASDSLVGFYGPGGADFGLVMDTSTGNVRLGKGLSLSPQRALHVEGTEVHSGGPTGGFSFADRTASSGAFVESPSAGQRWVWYSQGGQARLWSGTDQITIGKGGNGDALDVPRRMRVRQGNDSSAGIWFRQASGNNDHGFVGMASDSLVGFYGSGGANFGLVMDTSTGNVRLGKGLSLSPQRALHVEGTEVHSGGVSGGFSFSDRTASSGAFVESPAAGERWRWYAQGGQARLWSGTDQITIGKGANGDALDVPRRMRVRQGSDLSAGIWFRQKSADTDRGFVGMANDTLVGFYGSAGADFGLVMDTSTGNVRLGKGLSLSPQRALHVEGTEVHSGGPTGGFSFADRTASSGAFVESPSAGQRWVWYSQGGQARLWSGTDQITIGKGGNGDALDVPRRMRVRQGNDSSAGIWFRQASANTDRAFVGMESDSTVGLYGNGGVGWGLVMNTFSGNIGIGTTNPQNGRLDVRVGQGNTALATVGKVDIEGYQGYPSLGVRGQIELEARAGYTGLTIEQKPAYNAADIHGTLKVRGYEHYDAIYADGDVRVVGTITGRAQIVTIDHPEDPGNRYLTHTAVESPEMTTFYDGTIVTDDQGEATVELPSYFEKLNGDRRQDGEFRYQLTPVGCLAVAVVVDEIEHNCFTIRTDKPNVKVSWQVTGIRQDAWANANRMAAEVDKPEEERGLRRSAEAPAQPKSDNIPQEPETNGTEP